MRRLTPHTWSVIYLFLATTIWGLSYPINRYGLDLHLSPWALSGFRYMFGSLTMLPFAVRWRHRPAPAGYGGARARLSWLWGGAVCGWLLSAGAGFQLYGLAGSTAGKAGFITTLYVALVPVLGFILGQVPRPLVWAGLALGVLGLALMTGIHTGLDSFTKGDGLLLAADLFWAAHVLVMGAFAARVNPWLFVFSQSVASCLLGLGCAGLTGALPGAETFWSALPVLAWGAMSVGVAYLFQIMGQRDTPPTATAMIMQFQAVVAAFSGVIFLGETVTSNMVLGAAVILVGTLSAHLAPAPRPVTPDHPFFKQIKMARMGTALLLAVLTVALSVWAL